MARIERLRESASQTAGPYVHIGTIPNLCDIPGVYPTDLGVEAMSSGNAPPIVVTGRIIDGSNMPLTDALVEIWQADENGLYPSRGDNRGKTNRGFRGWARQPTNDVTGVYRFETIKPGPVPYSDGRLMAPHITFWIVARGINIGLHTRLYFGDEVQANASDPVLGLIEQRERVSTLIAARSEVAGVPTYTFDVYLQGPQETIFLDI
jgi:protocatechuate 3,4-dioxygenase alpha subunit